MDLGAESETSALYYADDTVLKFISERMKEKMKEAYEESQKT